MNTPVLQWIKKYAKNIIKNSVRPHITAIWTPLTRKRGCGRVVRHRRPGKDSRSRAWVRIPRAALFRIFDMKNSIYILACRFFVIQKWSKNNPKSWISIQKYDHLYTFSMYLCWKSNFIFSILERMFFRLSVYLSRKIVVKNDDFRSGSLLLAGWLAGWLRETQF